MRKPLGRRNASSSSFRIGRHLVYCEGTKTEPYYVLNISEIINRLYCIPCKDTCITPVKMSRSKATMELVNFAEEDVRKRIQKNEQIDNVWIFFDKDSFDDFDAACKYVENKNTSNGVNEHGFKYDENGIAWHLCWSNESFEVWVYLHFENLITPLSRDVYIEKINSFIKNKGYLGTYKKNNPKLFEFIQNNGGDIKKAIKFARTKDPGVGNNKPNPSTGVYSFAEFFNYYIENYKV